MSLQIKEKIPRNSSRLLRKTEIKNSLDYSLFFKKGFSHCRNLSVEYFDTNYYHNNEAREKMQQRLVKLLKKAKPSQSLDLHKCIIQYENIPEEQLIQIAKKTSRIRALSVPDYAVSQELVKKYALWLKYARRLTNFSYVAPPYAEFPQGQSSSYDKIMPKFLHEIRRDRIVNLNIAHKISDEKLGSLLLAFQKYPSTLKRLSFDWRNYSTDWSEFSKQSSSVSPPISLSHMRNLESLALAFRNQTDILDPMISSVESQLKHLKIEFYDVFHQKDQIPFERISELRNLNSLQLKFDMWPQGLSSFLQKIETLPLSKFCLDAAIVDESQLSCIKKLLSRLGNLEFLKLRISKGSAFLEKDSIQSIMEKIASLRKLKALKVEFTVPGLIEKQEELELDDAFVVPLKNLFFKAPKLEKFSFGCNQVNTQKVFMSTIASASRIASRFKKFEVNVGTFTPEENDLRQITNFTEGLMNIETLKFSSIRSVMSQSVHHFLDAIQNLRYLKEFEIYELQGSLNKKAFISAIEKLLSKRGLQKFDCSLIWDVNEAVNRRPKGYQIDPKKILEKNPHLRTCPESPIIFLYYNNDNAWKWSS